MRGMQGRSIRSGRVALFAAVMMVVALQARGASQTPSRPGEGNLTYARGQSVFPVYQGWTENPDGAFDLHFSYVNQNWEEEIDIPIGPNNNISPAPFGPDAGQPTHFLPRQNRWQFTVRVPKDFGSKEIVWTLTSHGKTERAFGTMAPGYAMDEFLMQFEFGGQANRGRKPPTIQVEGARERAVKVGQPIQLVAVAHDEFSENQPARGARGGGRGRGAAAGARSPGEIGPGNVGGDFIRSTAQGLRVAWLVYRGPTEAVAQSAAQDVTFDPPIPFKVWEDQRGGSPWAPGWQSPPVPPGNKWVYSVTFSKPGTYVLRVLVHTGATFAYENITFNVTR